MSTGAHIRRALALSIAILTIAGGSATATGASVPRVVGGSPAAAGSWPWVADLIVHLNSTTSLQCTGTVLAPTVVLTAAHCAADETSGVPYATSAMTVTTGTLDVTQSAGRQVSSVRRAFINPGWTPATRYDDVSLLQLTTPTTAPDITLAAAPGDLSLYDAGVSAQIAGFGRTSAGQTTATTHLQVGDTAVQDMTYCTNQAALVSLPFDPTREMCILDTPTFTDGACFGDSGGPLVAQRPDSTPVEIGVTSSVPGTCAPNRPDYYTRVDAMRPWIDSLLPGLALPTVTTDPASAVGTSSAHLNGRLVAVVAPTSYHFDYGLPSGPDYPTAAVKTSITGTTVPVTTTLGDLASGLTFRYRLVATNANGTTYGAYQTFTTSLPPRPTAGRYTGRTSQHEPISLRVASSRTALSSWSFSVTLHCSAHHHRRMSHQVKVGHTALTRAHGLAFADTFSTRNGPRYHVTGTFTTRGTVSGELSGAQRTHALGVCSSGTVRWSART